MYGKTIEKHSPHSRIPVVDVPSAVGACPTGTLRRMVSSSVSPTTGPRTGRRATAAPRSSPGPSW